LKLYEDGRIKKHEVEMETRRKDNQLTLDLFKSKRDMIPDAIPTLKKLGSVLDSFSRIIDLIIKDSLEDQDKHSLNTQNDRFLYCIYLHCRLRALDKWLWIMVTNLF
jgi:hypothetical protein